MVARVFGLFMVVFFGLTGPSESYGQSHDFQAVTVNETTQTACNEIPVCQVELLNMGVSPGFYVIYVYPSLKHAVRKAFFEFQTQAVKYADQLRKENACR
jgi:hypothetical protein